MQLRIVSLALASLVLQCTSVQAANLVQNPDCDTDVSGWMADPHSLPTFLSSDSTTGDPASPSCHVSTSSNGGALLSSCMPITAAQNVDFSINVLRNPGNDIEIEVFAFSDASCSTTFYLTDLRYFVTTTGWTTFSSTSVALPANTNGAYIYMYAADSGANFNFDHVQFGPTGTMDMIFGSRFE